MSDSSCIIIAITGASASGKSSIASTVHKELCNDLGCEEIGIIAEDSYYKDQSHLEMSERVKTNYEHPSSMDRDLLIQHLKDLKNGIAVDVPVYSYVDHTRTGETKHFTPKRIVILEGILLLTDERVRQLADISVFVDTPSYDGGRYCQILPFAQASAVRRKSAGSRLPNNRIFRQVVRWDNHGNTAALRRHRYK